MVIGTIPFKCSECGKRFMALDIEWNVTVFSAPQKYPKCGGMHTRAWSIKILSIKRFGSVMMNKGCNKHQ